MKWILVLSFLLSFAIAQAHETRLEDIEVIEHEDTQGLVDFVPGAAKLKGEELVKRRQTSLGDTLSSVPGVQSTSFGPSASRPVIRGLDGDRIRILQNGLGTLDASTQSLDHAIPVDTLTVDQLEIVRGPMGLLYGSSAVGGVVNIVTNRIHYDYEEGMFSKFFTQGETVNNGLSSAVHMNYGKNKWMFHVDGSTRNLGDMEIPGYARSSKLRSTDPQASEPRDKLPNSFNQQDNVAVGASKIMDRGYFGFSFNHFNGHYGSVAEPDVTIGMTQNRFEFHGEYRPETSSIRKWKFRMAQSDYFHKEMEGDVTGTRFKNQGNESRIEAHTKSGNLRGITGLQTQLYTFDSMGAEAFLPKSDNTKLALFSFQELNLGKNALRFSGRLESSEVEVKDDDQKFLGMNASLGHCYDFSKGHTLETSLSYTERAPNFQELYASGEHLATGTFEQGDSTLKKEKSYSLELNYKNDSEKNHFSGSVYSQVFHDYISLNPTGVPDPGGSTLPVYAYREVNALFYGVDLDYKRELRKVKSGVLNLLGKFDYVRAKDTRSGKNLPRISPPRTTLGLEYVSDQWTADAEVQYVAHQTKTAPFETRTEDYTLTNLGCAYNVIGNSSSLNLFARIRNLFDVEARNHVSTLKDRAPLPGRNFIVGAQLQI